MVVPLAIVAFALALRVVGLERIPGLYWDENSYAADGFAYIGRWDPHIRPIHPDAEIAEGSWMQPPLGKWLIAAGELPFGTREIGYRIMPALFGAAGVALTYLIGLELWGAFAGALAAFLLSIDGMHLVHSRIAMLDIFLSTFLLAGAYFLLREWRAPPGEKLIGRNGWFSAAAFGAAVAVKWSAIPYLIPAAIAMFVVVGRRRRDATRAAKLDAVVIAFGFLPAAIYVVSYTSFFVQNGADLHGFLRLQWEMFQFGRHFDNLSPARSEAWTWPLLLHPIDYAHLKFFQGLRVMGSKLRVVRVLAMGNPLFWWSFLAMLPAFAWKSWRDRDWRGAFVLGGYVAGWAPWLLFGRAKFIYYILPAVPFMALLVAGTLRSIAGRYRNAAVFAFASLALLFSALYYPVWTGVPLPVSTYLHLNKLPGVP